MHRIQNCLSILLLFILVQQPFLSHAQIFSYKWGQHAGGKNEQIGKAVCFDLYGNLVIGGGWQDDIDFNPPLLLDTSDGKGFLDNIFVAKYDRNGQYLWRFVLKSVGPYGISITDLETDVNGDITIGGNYASNFDLDPDPSKTVMTTLSGISNGFIAKYDMNGKYLWSVLLKASGPFSASVRDLETGSQTGAQGDVYVTGNFQQKVDFDPDSAIAQNLYGSSNSIYIARYSRTGNFVDVHFFYCADANYSYPTDLAVDKGGNVFVTGNLYSNTFAVDGFQYPNGPQLVSKGYGDIFLVKLNTNLDPAWSYAMNTSDREIPSALGLDDSSNVYITGDFSTPVDMDPGAGTQFLYNPNPLSSRQVFLAKYDSSGTYKWAKSFFGKGSLGAGLDLDMNRNIYLGIIVADTVWLNPGVDKAFVFSPGGGLGFVKLDKNGIGTQGCIYSGLNYSQDQAQIDVDPIGNLAITNRFFNQIDLDFSTGTDIYNSVDYSDAVTGVYTTCISSGSLVKPAILSVSDSICAGDSMRLRIVDNDYDQILWSTGKKDTFITIYAPGVYKVIVGKVCNYPMTDSMVIRQARCNNSGIFNISDVHEIGIFPNPASSRVNILAGKQQLIQTIVVYDMKGSMVTEISVKNPSSAYILDIEDLPAGAYLIKVIANNQVQSRRLMIAR